MLTKARQKWIRSLHLKKYRQQSNRFIAEGTKVVLEILHSGWPVESIYATADWLAQYGTETSAAGEVVTVKEAELRSLSALQHPSPVVAIVEPKPAMWTPTDLSGRLSLYLDHLRDPGNLGTIIRVADWFGIRHVCCTTDTVDLYNPKVVQATMGSLTRVQVVEVADDWWDALADLPVWGADMEGTAVYDIPAPVKGVLCIGSESHGLSDIVRSRVTTFVSIPRIGGAESLNAAMATGILLSHLVGK